MGNMCLLEVVTLLVAATGVCAHGFLQQITADGVQFRGYDPSFRFQSPPPKVPGWYADNMDIGFVPPSSFGNPDIICHKSATPGQDYVNVKAGSTLTLKWYTWPESHVGPIMDYLAPCPASGCTAVDKTQLRFVKLAQQALKPGAAGATGIKAWVVDTFIQSGFKHDLVIPRDLQSGTYVLRHEIIALHSASDTNGAQAYPQCVNLNVTGGGSRAVSGGTPATSFYKANDPGIRFNVYGSLTSYPFPGPPVWK